MANVLVGCKRCLRSKFLRNQASLNIFERWVSDGEIVIPPRIERGPLDILKALSSTVKPEKNVLHYKFQQGGGLSPKSVFRERILSLSMESGRKAAKWVVSENKKLFQDQIAEPPIKAFTSPREYNEDSDVSEAILCDEIKNMEVEGAIAVYKLLKTKNIDVSQSAKQDLLELLCFYNSTTKPDETLLEMKYYESPRNQILNSWKKDGFAEELFLDMEESAESYSALILGKFKHNDVASAFTLYKEAKEKGFKFGVEVYNALLEHIVFEKFQHKDQHDYMEKIFMTMAEENVKPNLGTLNSALRSVYLMRKWIFSRNFSLKILGEFKDLGIKPSLATYYLILEIFIGRLQSHTIFHDILSEIENVSFTLQDPDDLKFFVKAMNVAVFNFKNMLLAKEVHKRLLTGDNHVFLSGSVNTISYYRTYLTGAFSLLSLEQAEALYDEIVPHISHLDAAGTLVILNNLKARNGGKFLKKFWPHLKFFNMHDSAKTTPIVLSILENAVESLENEDFINMTEEIWGYIVKEDSRISMDSGIASSLLYIFSVAKKNNRAYEVFNTASRKTYIEFTFKSVNAFLDLCISLKDKDMAMNCMVHSIDTEVDNLKALAEKVTSAFQLSESELKLIEKISQKSEKARLNEFLNQ